jgi:hypothetical protein
MSLNKPKPITGTDVLAHGQVVILSARWILIATGLFLTLINPPAQMWLLRFQVAGLLALAVANFYLCAQVLLKRRTLEVVTYGASLADLVIITLLMTAQRGFESNMYVFYLPALLAMSVALPGAILVLLTTGVISVYGVIGLWTMPPTEANWQALIIRLLMFAAVAVVGYKFNALERRRAARARAAAEIPAASTVQSSDLTVTA